MLPLYAPCSWLLQGWAAGPPRQWGRRPHSGSVSELGLQVIVMEDREEYMARLAAEDRERMQRAPFGVIALVNPRLTPLGEEGARFSEGCLSVPGYHVRHPLDCRLPGCRPLLPAVWLACSARAARSRLDGGLVRTGEGGALLAAAGGSGHHLHASFFRSTTSLARWIAEILRCGPCRLLSSGTAGCG